MSRRVSISMDSRDWTALLEHLDRYGHEASTPCGRVREGLRRAMESKRETRKPSVERIPKGLYVTAGKLHGRPSKEEKRESRAAIRATLIERAGGICECGCGLRVTDGDHEPSFMEAEGQVDHMFGRGRGRLPESVETCWFLRRECHHQKTNNRPDAATWWRKFIAHAQRQTKGHFGRALSQEWRRAWSAAEARLRFVEVRASLPAAPRTGP